MKFVFGACGLALFLCVADSQAFATGKKVGLDGFPVTSYPPNDLDTVRPDNTVHFPAPANRKKDVTEITDTQPSGSLTGRIVYLNGGHGMAYSSGSNWPLGRSVGNNMTEDLGNHDQMTAFAYQAFDAGATVVPFRPIGNQTNQVIVDNTSTACEFFGTWTNANTGYYWGGDADTIRYRFTSAAASETALARYTPTIPKSGYYPVYTWARGGNGQVSDQLYRIVHPGGTKEVRINHLAVGNGWVYLGTYYLPQGTASSVEVSNQSATAGSVIADAIRFGNGMGDVVRGTGTSGRPKEDEASRYWVQGSFSNTATRVSTIYDVASLDDASDNVGSPPRMAAFMNNKAAGSVTSRILLSFHSNAKGNISPYEQGADGLWNNEAVLSSSYAGTKTPYQQELAHFLGYHVNTDLNALQVFTEYPWISRPVHDLFRTDFAFGEIRWDSIGQEMDATILEVAYHDHVQDAALMLDPKVRQWISRSTVKGLIDYFHQYDGASQVYPPDTPKAAGATRASDGIAQVQWLPPDQHPNAGGSPTGYIVTRSSNGYSFGHPVQVQGGSTTSTLIPVPQNETTYFRVTAYNDGGQSLPGEVVALKASNSPSHILIVNGFDRLDRNLNPTETVGASSYQRVKPWKSNTFDYVVQHASAINGTSHTFDTISNDLLTTPLLAGYRCVVWISGNESTADKTVTAGEQAMLTAYLAAGGSLFVSGSDIAFELDSTNQGRDFCRNVLGATYSANNSGVSMLESASGSIMDGLGSAAFGTVAGQFDTEFPPAANAPYRVNSADVITVTPSTGAVKILNYLGGAYSGSAAGIARDSGTYRTILLGLPFESITNTTARETIMNQALQYLMPPASKVKNWNIY